MNYNQITKWRIFEWTGVSLKKTRMTEDEIRKATNFLRRKNYPKPVDCPKENCTGYRPSCSLGVCYVAVKLCGDF